MYVESFVLTAEPPDLRGGTIQLGRVHDGAFAIEGFPGEIEFGALLELVFDEDDPPGSYEVELVLEYSRHEGAPQAPVGAAFGIEVVDPDSDWWGPRIVPQPLRLRIAIYDEFEGYLVVKVNGEEVAEKALRVFQHHVPEGI